MTKEEFEKNFDFAVERAVECARNTFVQEFPSECEFLLYPNQSYDGNPLEGDEQVFPNDSLPQWKFLGPFSKAEVINYVWREGKVPEWVDMAVVSQNDARSQVQLSCCGRYTASRELLYHKQEGNQPFHVTSGPIPFEWEGFKTGEKIDIYWQRRERHNGT